MADFRKWFLAFAVMAFLCAMAVPASAQVQQAMTCGTQNGGVTPTIRAEGLAELVGDVVLTCNGGVATPAGQIVPQATITIFLSTPLTSRLVANPFTEALFIADEPHSLTNPAVPMVVCGASGTVENPPGSGVCPLAGAPGTFGPGVGTYNPNVGGNVAGGVRPNVFQGQLTGNNQVTFPGVPIDPPGTATTRTFRITNVRSNANFLGVSSTLVPSQVTMFISVTPSTVLPLNNAQITVAFVQPGLRLSTGTFQFTQCVNANASIAGNNTSGLNANPSQNSTQFAVRFTEGFGSAWKEKNIQTRISNAVAFFGGATFGPNPASSSASVQYPADASQDIPNAVSYNTETGFESNGVQPSPLPPGVPALPPNSFVGGPHGVANAGVASQGTRLMLTFSNVPNGTQLFLPVRVGLFQPLAGVYSGLAVLLSGTDANGGGGFAAASSTSPGDVTTPGGVAPLSITANTTTAVYEVVLSDPTNVERIDIPVAVAFISNLGSNLPAPNVQSTVAGTFAPLSTVTTASASAPIPRFAPSSAAPSNTFIINQCSCNILFPFVTNQQGFDTGVAISNTSLDPFGTSPQQGNVTLNYYSGGTPPTAQTTNAVVPAGQTLTFTLSGGGNFGIDARGAGFQGYIIAQARFQYCHAFAYISAQGALPTAPGASEGYLGIILDAPTLNRTGQVGENLAH